MERAAEEGGAAFRLQLDEQGTGGCLERAKVRIGFVLGHRPDRDERREKTHHQHEQSQTQMESLLRPHSVLPLPQPTAMALMASSGSSTRSGPRSSTRRVVLVAPKRRSPDSQEVVASHCP